MLVEPSPYPVTIQDLVVANAPGPKSRAQLLAMLALPYLSPTWRARLTQQLAEAGGA